jgi:hypothetical protein
MVYDALVFVRRCQNWADDPKDRDARFDDGGFFFLPDDPTRNKPGEAGIDRNGKVRYRSYGSATADGLRVLLRFAADSSDFERISAAQRWLNRHFSASQHPGHYPPEREFLRQSVYYYYSASVGEILGMRENRTFVRESMGDYPKMAGDLAENLLRMQRGDGSWRNSAVDVREDDPLVATTLAIRALVGCKCPLRQVL